MLLLELDLWLESWEKPKRSSPSEYLLSFFRWEDLRSLYWEARQCLLWKLWPEMRLLTLPMLLPGGGHAAGGAKPG